MIVVFDGAVGYGFIGIAWRRALAGVYAVILLPIFVRTRITWTVLGY